MDATTGMEWLLTVAFIAFIIFLIGRELTCWYFKINEGRKNERQIIANQQQIIELLDNRISHIGTMSLSLSCTHSQIRSLPASQRPVNNRIAPPPSDCR